MSSTDNSSLTLASKAFAYILAYCQQARSLDLKIIFAILEVHVGGSHKKFLTPETYESCLFVDKIFRYSCILLYLGRPISTPTAIVRTFLIGTSVFPI